MRDMDSMYPYWTQAGEPVFSPVDTVFVRAIELGCLPNDHGYAWWCMCRVGTDEHVHGVSMTNPVVTLDSLRRFKERHI